MHITHPYTSVDASIRLTCHPRTSKSIQSGFLDKTETHHYSQRITVYNTRTREVEDIHVLAQVPVSQHAKITIKLNDPVLPAPSAPGTQEPSTSTSEKSAKAAKITSAVSAKWVDIKEGRFKWVVKVAPQEKLVLEMKWEVAAPADATIAGL